MLLICSCFHPRPSSVPASTRSPQGDTAATECRASGTRRSVRSPVLRYLLTCFEIWLRAVLFFWLLYYFFVYCKSFNVLFFGRRFIAAENLCKINTSFWHIQIFNKVFLFSPRTSARSRFRFSHRDQLVPESECKITAFFFIHQIFSDLFSDYFSRHGGSRWKLDRLN